jgi:hypothetical protein
MIHPKTYPDLLPNQDTEVDEVDKILTLLRAGVDPDTKQPHISWNEAKTALNLYYKSVLLEVIGADEATVNHRLAILRDDIPKEIRNKLRQELRQRLESRLGK